MRAAYLVELISFVGLSDPAIPLFAALGMALSRVDESRAFLGALIGVASEIIVLAIGSSP